jgi:hypothetical protein
MGRACRIFRHSRSENFMEVNSFQVATITAPSYFK